jgi:hypothetical protein
MKDGVSGDIGTSAGPRPAVESAVPRSRTSRHPPSPASPTDKTVRFFLGSGEPQGQPVLEQEFKTESEAMLESVKTGKTYFAVSEWRGTVDLSKKLPMIRKEAVRDKVS